MKPNYQYEKRTRDLERKKKQEKKRLKKLQKKKATDNEGGQTPPEGEPSA